MIYKDKDTILTEILEDVESVGLNNPSPLSPAYILANNYSTNMSRIYDDISAVEDELNPSKYSAQRLTEQASKHGIQRTNVVPMRDDTFSNFRFKLSNNVLTEEITQDPTKGFTIPSGTLIQGPDGERFFTADPAVFEPDDNTVFVRIYSLSDVSATTIEANVLTTHDVVLSEVTNVDPDKVDNVVLECSNTAALISETSTLSDEELTRLLSYEYNAPNGTNEDKVISAVLRLPGVASVTVIENFNGVGSVAVSIKPINPIASEGLYVAVEESLVRNVIGGDAIEVLRPEYLKVGLCLSVRLKEEIDNVDVFYNELRLFITGVVNAIAQGGELDPSLIEDVTKDTYTNVDTIEVVCMSINGKRALIQSQQALEEQKFIIFDPEIDVDINATFSS